MYDCIGYLSGLYRALGGDEYLLIFYLGKGFTMCIKTLLMSVLLASSSMTAYAASESINSNETTNLVSGSEDSAEHLRNPGGYYGGYYGGNYGGSQDYCRAYNRDGITCQQVGFYEGQIGAPWGWNAGQFLCVNGCLKWASPNYSAASCYSFNRDGISCAQVGYLEGQIGAPWGYGTGNFRCTMGCLQWAGW